MLPQEETPWKKGCLVFTASFQVKASGKIPKKRCKAPSGPFQGALLCDIIDDPQCTYVLGAIQ